MGAILNVTVFVIQLGTESEEKTCETIRKFWKH